MLSAADFLIQFEGHNTTPTIALCYYLAVRKAISWVDGDSFSAHDLSQRYRQVNDVLVPGLYSSEWSARMTLVSDENAALTIRPTTTLHLTKKNDGNK